MSKTVAYIPATPEQIFAVLTDAHTYADWVVGAKDIRSVEPEWPAPGSGFHHTVGVGPVALRDETRVRALDPPHRLELQARAWPTGEAHVTLLLDEAGAGTRVTMLEEPVKGPARWLHNPLLDAATHARNTVALRRLARLALART
jgi:uncharacterized protein YndB with AHSA1/START domain